MTKGISFIVIGGLLTWFMYGVAGLLVNAIPAGEWNQFVSTIIWVGASLFGGIEGIALIVYGFFSLGE